MRTTGEEQRQFVYCRDACQAFHLSFAAGNRETVYHATSGVWISIKNVASLIAERTGAEVVPGDAVGATVRVESISTVPGWNASTGIEAGIDKTISLYRREAGCAR